MSEEPNESGFVCPLRVPTRNAAPKIFFTEGKLSGYGKELSKLGIQEFVNRKFVLVPEGRSQGA
jgi:hypothetical protein